MERVQNAAYYHARQACYTCLNPNDLVDTSIQIDGEGVLAICKSCVADMARTAGFVLSDNYAEVERLKAEVEIQTERAEAAEAQVHALVVYDKRRATAQHATEVRMEKKAAARA